MRRCSKIFWRTASHVPAAFEFRHASWFTDSTWDLLKSHNVALCVAETETLTTPEVATAGFVYYRFRKPSYTGEERRSMIERIGQHIAAGRDVFAYFKHEETPEGALYAVELLGGEGAERAVIRRPRVARGIEVFSAPALRHFLLVSDNAHTEFLPHGLRSEFARAFGLSRLPAHREGAGTRFRSAPTRPTSFSLRSFWRSESDCC